MWSPARAKKDLSFRYLNKSYTLNIFSSGRILLLASTVLADNVSFVVLSSQPVWSIELRDLRLYQHLCLDTNQTFTLTYSPMELNHT